MGKPLTRGQRVILDELVNNGPMDDVDLVFRVCRKAGITPDGCCSRRRELVRLGKVRKAKVRTFQANGKRLSVWEAV